MNVVKPPYTYQVIVSYFCDVWVVKHDCAPLRTVLVHPCHISERGKCIYI
jgi:hypothetical protein